MQRKVRAPGMSFARPSMWRTMARKGKFLAGATAVVGGAAGGGGGGPRGGRHRPEPGLLRALQVVPVATGG